MTNASTGQEFALLIQYFVESLRIRLEAKFPLYYSVIVVARKSIFLLILLIASEITTKIRKDILRKIWRLYQIGACSIYHDSDVCFDFYDEQ